MKNLYQHLKIEVGDKIQLNINLNAKLSVMSYQHITYKSPLKKKFKCKILSHVLSTHNLPKYIEEKLY